jgi:O-antigen ligase
MARVVLLAGASLFLTVTAAASGSRSGALAALAALGIVALRTFGKWFLVTTLLAGGAIVTLTGSATFERFMRLDVVQSRWAPWLDMTSLFRFFPVFGSGVGTFAAAYWPYQRNATFEFWQHAHNDYLQWLVEAGVLGLLALGLVVRHLKRDLMCPEPLRECCFAAAGAFAVQAFFDFPSHVPASAAFLVCLLSLASVRRG